GTSPGAGYARRLQAIALASRAKPDLYIVGRAMPDTLHRRYPPIYTMPASVPIYWESVTTAISSCIFHGNRVKYKGIGKLAAIHKDTDAIYNVIISCGDCQEIFYNYIERIYTPSRACVIRNVVR
ncbi:MAG: hypothetical protein IJA83_01860, partial [Clostridia bacterium]|nr:hypothetical protein [Clostridia bacterium]